MKKASIPEAKNNLSALIDGLKNGSPVLIADRGRPVARLEPALMGDEGADEGKLARLVRDGVLRLGRAPPPVKVFATPPPRPDARGSALEALIAERREGR